MSLSKVSWVKMRKTKKHVTVPEARRTHHMNMWFMMTEPDVLFSQAVAFMCSHAHYCWFEVITAPLTADYTDRHTEGAVTSFADSVLGRNNMKYSHITVNRLLNRWIYYNEIQRTHSAITNRINVISNGVCSNHVHALRYLFAHLISHSHCCKSS